MPKYTKKFKIKFVLECLSGEWGGLKSIAKHIKLVDCVSEDEINRNNF